MISDSPLAIKSEANLSLNPKINAQEKIKK
jgi:hypothetical protein